MDLKTIAIQKLERKGLNPLSDIDQIKDAFRASVIPTKLFNEILKIRKGK